MSPRRAFIIDFAARRSWRVSRPGVLLLLAGASTLALACFASLPHLRTLQTLESERASLERTAARTAGARSRAPAQGTGPGEGARLAEAQRLATDLYHPWPALFDAIERLGDGRVHITLLGVDAGFSHAQLQVEARSLGDVVRYAQRLAEAGVPIIGAQLLSHEWTSAPVRVVSARVAVTLEGRPARQAATQLLSERPQLAESTAE